MKSLGRDISALKLCESNLIEEPVGAAVVGDVFYAVRKGDLTVEKAMSVPVFGAGELIEIKAGCHKILG